MTLRRRLARLPLRVRLVAGFSATMLLVLTAMGAVVYWRVQFALDRQLDGDLTSQTRALAPLVGPDGQVSSGVRGAVEGDLYQVLDRDGDVLAASPGLPSGALVLPATAAAALRGPVLRDVGALLPTTRDPLRVYVTALPAPGGQDAAFLVVAIRRNHRDEALLELLVQLSVAGFGALLATAFVGDRLARFALQPVERYRARAEEIIAGDTSVRLEVPAERHDEVTRLGDTLNTMLAALEGALERERQFVNDASHELRTPLTLLTTRVQLARRRPRTVAEHEVVLAEIETDVTRLVALAEHLLDVGGAQDTADRSADLAALATEAVSRRNALDRQPGPCRASTTAAGPVRVPLSDAAAEQLIGNLLDNAAKHGRPPVRVTVDHVDAVARMRVVDSGEGMDPDLLATATRRFTRAAGARSRDGFGLGLSLVERLVVGAGGQLRLCCSGHHTRHDGGSGRLDDVACDHADTMTVTVLIPLATPDVKP
ncbi:sensor histidine kinase [Nocardioides rubriscoriae]|uniref:sensor histidine kinase n=1 Tax=Nocardioides rubriscoriae TaxID=642762 RepID=UPI0011DF6BEF|nr:ATP-binding protein [Nocardioides rubriscoriae]